MKDSPSWSELECPAANDQASSPPASPNSDARSSTSSGISNSDSDNSCIISSMGSSSCYRAPSAYDKLQVLTLGCSPCGRSSSDESLAVILQVPEDSPGSPAFATSLYAPLKLEQRQRDAFRDFQVRSRSVRHDLELNLPTHVRLRPGDDPLPAGSERKKYSHFDSCVRPPPNRNPFTSSTTSTSSLSSCHSKSTSRSSSQSSTPKSSTTSSTHHLVNRCGKKAI